MNLLLGNGAGTEKQMEFVEENGSYDDRMNTQKNRNGLKYDLGCRK
jgi:hypothetical protein